MPDRFGQAFWPGVTGFISCTYTRGHGITPGIASLEVPEGALQSLRIFGGLLITDGVSSITIPDCRVQSVDFLTEGGRRVVLHIADRRWRWKYGFINGSWNVIDPYPDLDLFPPDEFVNVVGPYAPGTYRTAGNLIRDCLETMGEQFAIDPEPNFPLTTVWNDDVPAQALAGICDSIGYRVCLRTSDNKVLVAPQGVGKPLPANLPIISTPPSIQISTQPAQIRLVGDDVIYNDFVRLEPVGLEPTGEIKEIDDLSYKPANGWANCAPTSFWEAAATNQLSQQEARDLAQRCIWRMFRVQMVDVFIEDVKGPDIGGYGVVKDRKQIVLLPQVYGTTKTVQGQFNTSPPYLLGSICLSMADSRLENGQQLLMGNSDPTDGKRLPRVPQIDSERGLVTFDRQCYRRVVNGVKATFLPPELYLYTAMKIREIVGRKRIKFVRDGSDPPVNLNCPPEIIKHPELTLIYRTLRKNANHAVVDIDSNFADLIPAADYYLDRARAKYGVDASTTTTYAGIYPFDLDGMRQQITWRVGGGQPATTTVSINNEHDQYVAPYPERRRREKVVRFDGRAVKDAGGGGDFGGATSGGGANPLPNIPPGT